MCRFYVTTGTSLSESRCWFTEAEAGPLGKPVSNPTRKSREHFDHPKWSNLLTLLHLQDTLDPELVIDFIRTEQNRSRRFSLKHERCPITRSMSPKQAEQAAEEIVAQYFDRECWQMKKRHLLSAELATILAMSELGIFQEDHEIEFIGGESNKPETVLSCAVLRYVAGLDSGGFDFDPAKIHCSYDRELDPLRQADFKLSMKDLWRKIAGDGGTDFRLILTGGYKGVGLSLAAQIERQNTQFFYMHDEASPAKQDNYGVIIMDIDLGRPK